MSQEKLAERINSLTRREREVLSLVGQGYSLPSIAQQLYRSLKTIESHRLSLGRKLQVKNRVELARIAIQTGLAPLPGDANGEAEGANPARQRVAERAQAWQALQAIDAHVSMAADPPDVLQALTEAMAKQLSAEMVVVVSPQLGHPEDTSRVVAGATRNGPAPTVPVDAAVPPVSDVLSEGYVEFHPLPEPYREHPLLSGLSVETLYGIRLGDYDAQPTGVLLVAVERALPRDMEVELLLRAVASRASAELDDMRHLQLATRLAAQLSPRGDDPRTPRVHDREFVSCAHAFHDGMGVIDAGNVLMYVNPALAGWLERDPEEELIGRDVSIIQTHEQAAWFCEVQPLREKGSLNRYRLQLMDRNGKVIPTIVYPASVFDDAGTFVGSFGLMVRL